MANGTMNRVDQMMNQFAIFVLLKVKFDVTLQQIDIDYNRISFITWLCELLISVSMFKIILLQVCLIEDIL